MTLPLYEAGAQFGVRLFIISLAGAFAYASARGIIGCAEWLCRGLFGFATGFVSWIPWLGHKADHGIDKVRDRVINYLSYSASVYEEKMWASLHSVATLADALADDVYQSAVIDYTFIHAVLHKYALPLIQPRVKHLQQAYSNYAQTQTQDRKHLQNIDTKIKHARTGAIGAAIVAGTATIAHELGAFRDLTLPKVKADHHAITHDIPHSLGGIRVRVGTLEELWHGLRSRLGKVEKATIGLGAVALVLGALTKLGLGLIRCSNVKNSLKSFCGINPSLLETLLLGTTAIFGGISLVTMAEALLEVEKETTPLILKGFSEFSKVKL